MTSDTPGEARGAATEPALARPDEGEEPEVVIGWREAATVCGLLLLLIAAAYGNVVFGGRSLVYSDNYNPLDYRWLPENYGPGFVPISVWSSRNLLPYTNFHDPGVAWWQWEPGGEFLRRALRRGEWPWWDPYVGAGAPAMANMAQSYFYPPYVLLVALGNGTALKNVYFLAVLLSAAFFSYLLLRKHHLSPEASFAGAVAVLFCGGLSQNVGSTIGQAAACLPPALWVTRYFLDRPSWRRTAILAAVYAGLALASFPPLLLAAFGLSALYAGVLIAAGRDRARRAGRYLTAVVLSLGLVAFYYLPAFAAIAASPQVDALYKVAGRESLSLAVFSQLLSPVLMGGGKVWADPPMPDLGPISLPYLGLVAILIAALAGPVGPRQTRLFFWVVATGVALVTLKLAGIEPVHSLGRLPGLRTIHFAHYFGIPLNMLLGFATALGLERLLSGRVSRTRVGFIAMGLANVAGAMYLVARVRGVLTHPHAADWISRWKLLVALLVVTAGIALFLAGRRPPSPRRRQVFAAAVVGLLALEGGINTYHPRQQRWDVWRHPSPYLKELLARRDSGRIYSGAPSLFTANAASAFELFGLDSLMTFNAPRTFDLYKRYAAPQSYLFLREASLLPPDGVLDAANVSLVTAQPGGADLGAEAGQRGYRKVFDDGFARLFERPTEPRYYFSSEVRRTTRQQALAALAAGRRPREILVEETLPFPAVPNDGREPPVVVQDFARNRVVLRVKAPRPGLLYAAESFYPGWKAEVNGRPTRIRVANYAFRAVPVPAGDAVVELRYVPPGLAAGLAVSLVAGLLTALLAFRQPGELAG